MASPLRHFSVSPLWDVSNPAILRRPETREIEIRVNGNDLALDNFLYWGTEKKKHYHKQIYFYIHFLIKRILVLGLWRLFSFSPFLRFSVSPFLPLNIHPLIRLSLLRLTIERDKRAHLLQTTPYTSFPRGLSVWSSRYQMLCCTLRSLIRKPYPWNA